MSRARPLFAFAAATAALVLGTPASAQAPGGLGGGIDVDFGALSSAKVGAWADYAMTVPNQPAGDKPTVRYALVDKSAGKMAIEIDTTTPKGELDMRIDFTAQGADAWKVSGGKMKMGTQVMDFPQADIARSPPIKKADKPGDLVGTEDVVTPVGTFSCRHYKKTMAAPGAAPGKAPASLTMDLWMSDKVSPTGLVKSSIGPMSMLLAATGKGAEAKVK